MRSGAVRIREEKSVWETEFGEMEPNEQNGDWIGVKKKVIKQTRGKEKLVNDVLFCLLLWWSDPDGDGYIYTVGVGVGSNTVKRPLQVTTLFFFSFLF